MSKPYTIEQFRHDAQALRVNLYVVADRASIPRGRLYRATSSPELWWNNDLPGRIRHAVESLALEAEERLQTVNAFR